MLLHESAAYRQTKTGGVSGTREATVKQVPLLLKRDSPAVVFDADQDPSGSHLATNADVTTSTSMADCI